MCRFVGLEFRALKHILYGFERVEDGFSRFLSKATVEIKMVL